MIELKTHQENAILAFESNAHSGILEMATGSGKTYTAIEAARRFCLSNGRGFIIVLVPFQHLIKQWQRSLDVMGFPGSISNNSTTRAFHYELDSSIRDYKTHITNIEVAVLCYQSAINVDFVERLKQIGNSLMIISDECHYMGAKSYHKLFRLPFCFKLGLSATPDRWWDEEGTQELMDFFNGKVYQYGIQESIRDEALTPYEYHAHSIPLDQDEMEQFVKLSDRIKRVFQRSPVDKEQLEKLLIMRARLLNGASGKTQIFRALLKKYASVDLKHMIVFVGPSQIVEYLRIVEEYGLKAARFDSTFTKKERETMISQFESGDIQVLVAIKCLDEGVDIPQAKLGILVSSTTNPREFIQRRGRLLRVHRDKTRSIIHDLVIFNENAPKDVLEKMAYREIPRVSEFSRESLNKYQARDTFYNVLKLHNLESLLDKTPWEVYQERKELYVDEENA